MKPFFLPLALMLVTSVANAEFNYASYQPSSYTELLTQEREFFKSQNMGTEATLFSAAPEKYTITVKYSGKFVEINQQQRQFLTNWQQSLPAAESFIKLYEKALVVEGLIEPVEIPIQQSLLPSFEAELTSGQEIKLYVVKAGWSNNTLILLATEFAQQ